MIKALFIIALALLPEVSFSQATNTPPPPSPPLEHVTRVVHIRYGNPNEIVRVIRPGLQAVASGDNILKVIVLNGQPKDVAAAEQIIKELDVPPVVSTTGDIELLVQLIGGSNEPVAPSSNSDLSTIEPVLKQLHTIFPYKNYELLSTMLMRSQQGTSAESSGLLKYPFGAKASSPDSYQIAYGTATVSSDKLKPTIHLGNFKFNARIATVTSSGSNTSQYQSEVGIKSDIDLRPGQQVVVGNTNVANGDSALFIVLSAKLVN